MPDISPAPAATVRAAPAAARQPAPRHPRRSLLGVLLPVSIGQLIVWQVAALAVLAGWQSYDARIALLAAGGLAIAGTSIRVHGQCGYQWAVIAVVHRRRARRTASTPAPDRVLAVVPTLRTRSQVDRAGNRVGVACVDDSYGVVFRIDLRPGGGDLAGLARLLRTCCESTDVPLAAAQIVVATPDPTGGQTWQRVCWVALRYRSALAPKAALARGGGDTGAVRATVSAAVLVAQRLAAAGYAYALLDVAALHDHLLLALGAQPPNRNAAGSGAALVAETWRDWSAGPLLQSCYRPAYGVGDAACLAALERVQAGDLFTCAAYTLARGRRGALRGTLLVRAGTPEQRPARGAAAAALGIPLDPLDGRHAPSVPATLPLAL